MIDEKTLMSFSHYFADIRHLEKDYLINLMLKAISVNKVSNDLDFKGGTALYMFHGLNRFSEDLDFTYIGKDADVGKRIDTYMDPVVKDFDLSYPITKSKGNVIVRDAGGKIAGIRTELFIEGPLFERTGVRHKIKIDLSIRNDTVMKPEAASLVSKYGDIGAMLVRKMPIEEILAEKMCAIVKRHKARDLYDIYFMFKHRGVKYDERMVAAKLEKRDEIFDGKALLNGIDGISAAMWREELAYLVKDMPEIKEVAALVKSRIV